jgi:N-acetylmuramoyl-L-alanine amidase
VFSAAFQPSAEAAAAAVTVEQLPTFGGGTRAIELLPWQLAQTPFVDRSVELATIIGQQLRDRVPLSPKPIDRAPLRVLEAANMPAVLVEAGYLTNPDQEKQLTTNEFQNTFVQAIYDSVLKFRELVEDARRPAAGGGQ